MVDATRSPIDFKALDRAHVDACATRGRCGICGARIRRGPIAFIGPDDGRTCFADPWMHPDCADLALEQCPFLAGRRDWSDQAVAAALELTLAIDTYRPGAMVEVLADSWRSHRDPFGRWHFEALGGVRPIVARPPGSGVSSRA
jgi:hypothetical protein